MYNMLEESVEWTERAANVSRKALIATTVFLARSSGYADQAALGGSFYADL